MTLNDLERPFNRVTTKCIADALFLCVAVLLVHFATTFIATAFNQSVYCVIFSFVKPSQTAVKLCDWAHINIAT